MRAVTAFHTLCPECDARVPMTLAAKLQSARLGSTVCCHNCRHEWICIQEWVYPNQPLPQPVLPGYAIDVSHAQPGQIVMQPPRPHLPTYQPPGQQAPAQPRPVAAPVPHAWAPPQPFAPPTPSAAPNGLTDRRSPGY